MERISHFKGDGTIYTCDCGKSYGRPTSLHNHKVYRCGKQPQFNCPYCSHRTWHKGNLKTHVRIKHPEKPVDTFLTEMRM
ncbi:hypothetical protein J6590_002328 [Homalodisca vitripennis]|nr:hypothetical protein J6590_002328 [Homalodisca vitripennis]